MAGTDSPYTRSHTWPRLTWWCPRSGGRRWSRWRFWSPSPGDTDAGARGGEAARAAAVAAPPAGLLAGYRIGAPDLDGHARRRRLLAGRDLPGPGAGAPADLRLRDRRLGVSGGRPQLGF